MSLLQVQELNVQWFQFELRYDHGPIRCLHGSCLVQNELIIHSGCTQEYHTNRLELDDHAESIQHWEFGIKSLLKLALEASLKLVYNENDLEILPLNLQVMIKNRKNPKNFEKSIMKCGERVFSSSVMFSGL